MKGFRAFVIFGVPAWTLAEAQTNVGSSGMHAGWLSHWNIKADDHDIVS